MKTYPEYIEFTDSNRTRKLKLYNLDNDIGIYYSLVTNFFIGVGWSLAGLRTISADSNLDNINCFEITKREFYK